MRDPLQRLYATKMMLLATILTIAGLALMVVAGWVISTNSPHWLADLPISDVGSALFTTGLVVIALEYLDGRDGEERAGQRLRRVLRSEAPAIRDAVIDGFAFKSDDLARVATPETLDQIVRNSLALRLDDEAFAAEVYDDIRDQAIRAPERWHGLKISVDLSPDQGDGTRAPSFVTTVRWEYTVVPRIQTRRFACVSDRQEYRELAQDPTTSTWYIRKAHGIDAASKDAFELVQFTVDGEKRTISRAARKSGQVYTVNVGRATVEEDRPVVVSYTYRATTPQHGHLLHFDMEQPTRGASIELNYGNSEIAYVNVLDFIASTQKSRVSRTPTGVPGRAVSVDFDGWVFPRSGVAFVWVLDRELAALSSIQRR
jgi:hypothetical protein